MAILPPSKNICEVIMNTKPKELLEDDDDIEVVEIDSQDDDRDDDERLEADHRESVEDGEDGNEENLRQLRRKRQKQRQKDNMRKTREENTGLLRELAEAKERLAALESRNVQTDAQTAEQQYNYALQQVSRAESDLKEAFETGDGEKAIRAQRLRETAIKQANDAEDIKRQLTNSTVNKGPTLDRKTENLAQQWMSENSWFSPNGTDEDSVVARAIDEAWAVEARQQGITPASEDYWDELDSRVKRRLGNAAADRQRKRGAPPPSGRGEVTTSTTKERVFLSPERIKALKDANAWDDPDMRKRYIRRFQEWDKQNASR
jgi:hypothetical protein